MKMSTLSRHRQEELSMIIIYQCISYDDSGITYDVKEVISNNLELPFEEVDLFIRQLVVASLLYKQETIDLISKNLKRWSYKRLDYVTKAILLMSSALYYHMEKIDRKIVIDTAIKLSKKYSDPKAYRLINAILENILND